MTWQAWRLAGGMLRLSGCQGCSDLNNQCWIHSRLRFAEIVRVLEGGSEILGPGDEGRCLQRCGAPHIPGRGGLSGEAQGVQLVAKWVCVSADLKLEHVCPLLAALHGDGGMRVAARSNGFCNGHAWMLPGLHMELPIDKLRCISQRQVGAVNVDVQDTMSRIQGGDLVRSEGVEVVQSRSNRLTAASVQGTLPSRCCAQGPAELAHISLSRRGGEKVEKSWTE